MSQLSQTVNTAVQPLYVFGKWIVVAGMVMLVSFVLTKILAKRLGMNRKQSQAFAQLISSLAMLGVLLIGFSKAFGA
ncbi:hypothetical protein [Conchiformibius kuhniae]|uniref:Uncharacterized protein n=1 Tax=Conchiformibius kuhniae TaxID=211502 RepID=A0A8T9MZJ7_9NEIS|nr:hypothetical protein [Conchiformibius kuhniae]UOP05213.1 hypothetical protein LVJ77_02980 [Conchiformibius kuhniae]